MIWTKNGDSMDVSKIPVFPPADVFPMMSDDELQELAADIKENGLREPIVVAEIPDGDGVLTPMLIDGRNRCAACSIAEIVPEVRQLNGEDPTAFVLSANIHRRHMTKGQRAMAVAMIYPEPTAYKRGGNSLISKELVSSARISQARTVLVYAPDLADNVLSGAASLDDAYRTARERKTASASDESQLADLRGRFPELADKVVEGELSLEAAKVEADHREKSAFERRESSLKLLKDAIYAVRSFNADDAVDEMREMLSSDDDEIQKQVSQYFKSGSKTVQENINGAFESGARNILSLSKVQKGKK